MSEHHGIHYFELPTERNIRRVAVCPATNVFAVATRNNIRVWKYTQSFIELLYDIKVDFDVEKIDIFNEYLVYASFAEFRVIRVTLEQSRQHNYFDGM